MNKEKSDYREQLLRLAETMLQFRQEHAERRSPGADGS